MRKLKVKILSHLLDCSVAASTLALKKSNGGLVRAALTIYEARTAHLAYRMVKSELEKDYLAIASNPPPTELN